MAVGILETYRASLCSLVHLDFPDAILCGTYSFSVEVSWIRRIPLRQHAFRHLPRMYFNDESSAPDHWICRAEVLRFLQRRNAENENASQCATVTERSGCHQLAQLCQ